MKKTRLNYKSVLGYDVQRKDAPFWLRTAYRMWNNQRTRCRNKKNINYQHYGAKGIKLEYGFLEFVEWFLENLTDDHKAYRKTGGHIHVGRIDHLKNYTLDNIEILKDYENSQERIRRLGTPVPRVVVIEYWKKSRKIKNTYPSIRAAADHVGVAPQNISSLIKLGENTRRKRTYFMTR